MAKRPADGVTTRYKRKVQFKNSGPDEKIFSATSVEEAWTMAFDGYQKGTKVQLFYETEPYMEKWQMVSEKAVPPKLPPANGNDEKSKEKE